MVKIVDISLKTTNIDLLAALWDMSDDHKGQKDTSSGDYEWLWL